MRSNHCNVCTIIVYGFLNALRAASFTPSPHLSNNVLLKSVGLQPLRSSAPYQNPISLLMTNDATRVGKITSDDNTYMRKAIEAASLGLGNTYPNPAVGCVLVSSNEEVIGVGFHPRAGYPHAEVFALLEACGYVKSGLDSAKSIVQHTKSGSQNDDDLSENIARVNELLETYSSESGAKTLFEGKLTGKDVTAYVTLEPCCHYGKTPPCALSLVQAGVSRVVVGFRDPNPKVDGGGVLLLENEGIKVDVMNNKGSVAEACANIVSAFVKRISPRAEEDGAELADYSTSMNGAKRSFLRNRAGRNKMDGSMVEFSWPNSSSSVDAKDKSIDMEEVIAGLELSHAWMEAIDGALWDHEIILLKLSNAIKKKKGAKILGERIAEELNAHVAQVVGHTALLYRPGRPVILDLKEVVAIEE
jgi:diaminohydroxyphosphoribosylaminopyrimidine deaminase/5-amino-6-(5-phosphoribosylamino)uracil reductase|eukprot:scaffold996_cov271-Chaetoceros_neogracile.AAC.33